MLDALSHAIVRPPRRNYFKEDLIEASELATTNTSYKRIDVSIDSSKGHKLEISIWNPSIPNDCCLLYFHPNSGNRMDTIRSRALSVATSLGCSVRTNNNNNNNNN
jgi:hypothetical protein